MSESDAGTSTVRDATLSQPGFLKNLIGLYFGPTEAFAAIVKRPLFWAPLAVFVLLQLVFTGVWLQNMDVTEFLRSQAEEAGNPFQEPPSGAMGFIKGMFWASALLFAPLFVLVVAAVYLFIFRFFLASDVTFKQAFTIVAYAFLVVALVTTPLILLTMWLKGDWNVDPRTAVAANATLFLEKSTTPKWLYALAGAIDIFYLWMLWLMAAGFAAASRRTIGGALPGIVFPWAMLVVAIVGWAALF